MVPTNAVFDASHISRNACFNVGLLFGPLGMHHALIEPPLPKCALQASMA